MRKTAVVAVPVRHASPAGQLWVVVVRQKGEAWYLITKQPVETEKHAWEIVFLYMKRWTMETSFRYAKSELLWKWEEREKLLLMVTLVYAFLLSLLDVTLQPVKEWLFRQDCHPSCVFFFCF